MPTTDRAIDDDRVPRRAWLALGLTNIIIFFVVIDISAVNVAFPNIRDEFGATDSELSWIIGAYNIALGAFLMVFGRLADSIGRRKVYLPGVAVFGLGSVLCALAPGVGWLIAARIVQAVGGSIVTAAGFAVFLPEFPANRRATAIGLAGMTGGLGGLTGPVIGSVLIDLWSWRGIFWLNAPLCVLVVVLGPRFLTESRDPDATGRIDVVGVAVGTSAVALVMYAIVQSESWGLADPRIAAFIVLGFALAAELLRRSRTHPEPLLNLELFRYRSFRSANIGVIFYGLAFISGFLVNSIFLQDVWDLPVREVGLALAPSPLISAIVSPITGRWADRIGHRWLLGGGCLALGTAFLSYVLLLDSTPRVWTGFVPLSLLAGLGVGLTVATWSSAGVSDIPQATFGVASATYNTVRQAANGLGVSIVITVIAAAGAETSMIGIERAYLFVSVSYFLAAISVMLTFPAGSARDRAAISGDSRA